MKCSLRPSIRDLARSSWVPSFRFASPCVLSPSRLVVVSFRCFFVCSFVCLFDRLFVRLIVRVSVRFFVWLRVRWFVRFCLCVRSFAGVTRLSPVPSPGTHTRDRVGKREGPVNREEASVERVKRELNSRQFFTVHCREDAAKRPVFGEELRSQQIAQKTLSKRLGF